MSRSPFSQQGGKCYTVLEVEILLTYRFCETIIHTGNKGSFSSCCYEDHLYLGL